MFILYCRIADSADRVHEDALRVGAQQATLRVSERIPFPAGDEASGILRGGGRERSGGDAKETHRCGAYGKKIIYKCGSHGKK